MVIDRFYFSSGDSAGSLEEFLEVLRSLNDECFFNHVNEERNDFLPWLRDCVGDRVLASRISKMKDKEKIIVSIEKRLKSPTKVKESIIDKIKHAILDD